MSWETLLKRSRRKKINMPLFREALGNATATLAEFTISEILPFAQELYREYLIRDSIYPNTNAGKANASMHAKNVFKVRGRGTSFYGVVIKNLGVHTATKRMKTLPSGARETIYVRREE
jgi:hypothetical protein